MLRLIQGTPHTPWWRGGLVTSDPPPEAEMNRTAVLSTDLRVETRGDSIYRVLHGGKWSDFRVDLDGSAVWVAGTHEPENVSEFEYMAAQLIAIEEGK